MPEPTDLKAADLQILFADLQPAIVARSKTTDPESLTASAGVLGELAGVFDLPVTLSVVPDADRPPQSIPELAKRFPQNFPRQSASPFLDVATRSALASHRRPVLVIAGFATEVVVLHAVVAARRDGYRVIIPVDACGGMSDRTERAALGTIALVGAEVSSVVTLATSLSPDFTTEQGQRMFAVIQKLRLA